MARHRRSLQWTNWRKRCTEPIRGSLQNGYGARRSSPAAQAPPPRRRRRCSPREPDASARDGDQTDRLLKLVGVELGACRRPALRRQLEVPLSRPIGQHAGHLVEVRLGVEFV